METERRGKRRKHKGKTKEIEHISKNIEKKVIK